MPAIEPGPPTSQSFAHSMVESGYFSPGGGFERIGRLTTPRLRVLLFEGTRDEYLREAWVISNDAVRAGAELFEEFEQRLGIDDLRHSSEEAKSPGIISRCLGRLGLR